MSAQGEPASRAWPAAVCAVSWALFGLAVLVAYAPGGPLDPVVGPILALPPAALAALGAVRPPAGTPAGPSRAMAGRNAATVVRLGLAAGVALLLVPLSATILGGSAPSPLLDGPDVRRVLPGPSEGWAYLAAAGLTVAAIVPGRRGPVIGALTVLATAALSGAVIMAWNAAGLERGSDAGAAGCSQHLRVAVTDPIRSAAAGDLDGAPLGSVVAVRRDGGPLSVQYDTRWGTGTAEAAGDDPATLGPLLDAALSSDERVTADDLGIDLDDGGRRIHVVQDTPRWPPHPVSRGRRGLVRGATPRQTPRCHVRSRPT